MILIFRWSSGVAHFGRRKRSIPEAAASFIDISFFMGRKIGCYAFL
jgi:hypothetical protein